MPVFECVYIHRMCVCECMCAYVFARADCKYNVSTCACVRLCVSVCARVRVCVCVRGGVGWDVWVYLAWVWA